MNKQVKKIRKEIERLIGEYRLSRSCEAKYRTEAYKELLEYIDGMSEFDAAIQEGDEVVVNEDGSRFNRSQLERFIAKCKESELDFEINKWRNHYIEVKRLGCDLDLRDIEIVARHFAEWQRNQYESM